MEPLVDTHTHLHRSEFDADRESVLKRAKEAGVVALLDPATDFQSNRTVVELAKKDPCVYAAVGLHPHHADQFSEEVLQELSQLAADPRVVAIGEIGLDDHREHSDRKVQRATLERLLSLAHTLGKPVILHCRGSELPGQAGADETYRSLFAVLKEVLKPPIRGVLHCFSGGWETVEQALEMGLSLSFAGNLTFKNALALQEVAKRVPLDRVLLETDAPFLSPQAFRGKRNEPSYLPELVRTWAQLKDLSPEDVARTTAVSAYHLFGIGPVPDRGRIAYAIRNSLYINLTNACTDRCVFCSLSVDQFWKGEGTSPFVKGHHLRMSKDPSVEEILTAVRDPSSYDEVVFCGYGEPIIRLAVLLEVGRRLKAKGVKKIRLNTNGHGNLIHRRSIARELVGVIDEVSVSLNTPDAEQYLEICRPVFGLATYDSIKTFIRECRDAKMKVVATVVPMPQVDVEACRRVATEELKVDYRVRTYDDVG